MRRVTLLQMLPPQALLATILFFQFFRSGVSSTTTITAVTTSSAISSASSNQSVNASNSSYITETPSANHNFSATSVAKAGNSSRTVVNGGQGDSSVLPTKSSAPSVYQTASVSIAYSKRICTFRINNPDTVLLNINTKKTMTVS